MPAHRTRARKSHSAFSCAICHKTYSKAEHLQRHERAHTGAKPFSCQTCGRQFSRLDSLTRHERIHTSEHPSRRQSHNSPQFAPTSADHREPQFALPSFENNDYHAGIGLALDPALADMTASNDFSMALEWPDSEALLQSITSYDWTSLALPPGSVPTRLPVSLPIPASSLPLPQSEAASTVENIGIHSPPDLDQLSPNNSSHEAVQSLSHMVSNLSRTVTSAVDAMPELTSVFMNNCLQAYFAHFNPHFTILHRPTFVFRDCSPSLILNAIALGSLYIGTADAIRKGEALWRLAHTAVATSWPDLIRYKGPYDTHEGAQLILTALLGQCYAIMSKNENLRLTSQVFHSLGFNWASQCSMFTPSAPVNNTGQSDQENLTRRWKIWVSSEVQRRALLGHYILDGQLSYLLGHSASSIHVKNPLSLSTCSRAFEAQSANEWHQVMEEEATETSSFQEVYSCLFPIGDIPSDADKPLRLVQTSLDARVILECLHVLARENRSSQSVGSIVAIPSLEQVQTALVRIHSLLTDTWILSHAERLELTIRWHFVCMDTLCDPVGLLDQLCRHFEIGQRVFKTRSSQLDLFKACLWVKETCDAKRALLHAIAVHDITNQLPLNYMQSFWMSLPLLATSVIYAMFRLSGISSICVPSSVHWKSAVIDEHGCPGEGGEHLNLAMKRTRSFLALETGVHKYALGPARNLPFELKKSQLTLHFLALQWGISSEMEDIVLRLDEAIHAAK